MFNKISPEQAGISSGKVENFINTINRYHLDTHSVIMARGNDIFAESYYAPYHKDYLHRQYSVSKSFVSIAIGLAAQEGLLSLDDKFMDYLPEYENENVDWKFREATIRDMLSMRSCMAKNAEWWGYDDRAAAYFSTDSNQVPGTNFCYDSPGSFLLGCIVEKVTGMLFLDYLKDRFLLEIGFSKESYCLLAPGGHSHCDSGVMCTARDLLIFARFVMNGGVWNGKRYINEEFMKAAVAFQTDSYVNGNIPKLDNTHGYGYLIWKMPRDGFAFLGLGTQYVICDPETDFIFIINSANNECEPIASTLIMHELYTNIIPNIGETLKENPEAHDKLLSLLNNQKLMHLENKFEDNIANEINGNKYILEKNYLFINYVKLTFEGDKGVFEFEDKEGVKKIYFGVGYNVFDKYPGTKRMGLTASHYVDGTYDCAASASWCQKDKIHIIVRIIDTYIGELSIVVGFKGDKVSVTFHKHAQRILIGFGGIIAGIKEKDE